jgi:putative heme degradation protein
VLNPIAGEYLNRSVIHFDREIDGEFTLTVAQDLAHVVVETKHLGRNLKLFDGNAEEVSLFAGPNGGSVKDDLGLMLLDDHRCLHLQRAHPLRRIPQPTA